MPNVDYLQNNSMKVEDTHTEMLQNFFISELGTLNSVKGHILVKTVEEFCS